MKNISISQNNVFISDITFYFCERIFMRYSRDIFKYLYYIEDKIAHRYIIEPHKNPEFVSFLLLLKLVLFFLRYKWLKIRINVISYNIHSYLSYITQ